MAYDYLLSINFLDNLYLASEVHKIVVMLDNRGPLGHQLSRSCAVVSTPAIFFPQKPEKYIGTESM